MNEIKHSHFFAMGTRIDLVFPYLEDDIFAELQWVLKNEVERIHYKLSFFDKESDISHINNEAWKLDVMLDEELFDILTTCQYFHDITLGQFDITLRPVYDYYKNNDSMSDEDLAGFSDFVGQEKIVIDRNQKTIRALHPNTKIDLGGFGKGYALELVKNICKDYSIKDGLINFGNSTIYALGSHPNGDCWKIGVQNVFCPTKSIYVFELSDEGLSFSGNSYVKEKLHMHIINPEDLTLSKKIATFGIKGVSAMDAELLSTAMFTASDIKKSMILRNLNKEISGIEVNYQNEADYTINQFYYEKGKYKQAKVY